MVLTVRPAVRDDAPAMNAVLTPLILAGGTSAIGAPLTDEMLCRWFIDGPGVHCCHLAEAEGTVVGWQSVGTFDPLPEGWGDMATFTAAGHAQRGIGTALFAATLACVRARGLLGLNAQIRADNAGGLAYYGRMGFQDHSVQHGVPLSDGRPVDRITKRLILTVG